MAIIPAEADLKLTTEGRARVEANMYIVQYGPNQGQPCTEHHFSSFHEGADAACDYCFMGLEPYLKALQAKAAVLDSLWAMHETNDTDEVTRDCDSHELMKEIYK